MDSPEQDLARRLALRPPRELALPESAQAAVAVILGPAAESAGMELLLIRRAERELDPWSGHMALPGGRRDRTDADLCATAIREAREETGVDLTPAACLGRLHDLEPIRESARRLSVRPFVFWVPERPALQFNAEVAAGQWVTLARLRATEGETTVDHGGTTLRVSAYDVEGRAVWGITQRVIASLLELVPG